MSTITDRNTWRVDSQEVRMGKGNLVRVKLGENHFVKMYEADAIAAGLLPGKPKARPQAENKMMPEAANKAATAEMSPTGQAVPEADDLTTIPGIGLGVVRSLAARGITTFAQLRAADDLSFLSKKAMAAVEAWKNA